MSAAIKHQLLPAEPAHPLITSLFSLGLALAMSLALTVFTSSTPMASDINVPDFNVTQSTANLCGASLCSARWFPFPTRLHIVHYYLWIAATGIGLYYRDIMRPYTSKSFSIPRIPFILPKARNYFSVGNIFMVLWVLFLFGNGVGVWWQDMRDTYAHRAGNTEAAYGTLRLAVTGVTGHIADLALGLSVLTVARTTLLTTTLNVARSTLLSFHIFCAYVLLLIVLIHMATFYTWVPLFAELPDPAKKIFFIDNPTFTEDEVMVDYYRAVCLAAGMAALLALIYVTATSFSYCRAKKYDFFYLSHMATILVIALACIHADTDFYCVMPGLFAWIGDWLWRARGLYKRRDAVLTSLGKGWYRVDIPVLPNLDLVSRLSTVEARERVEDFEGSSIVDEGMFRMSALNAYYLCVPQISKWALHPFTSVTDMVALKQTLADGVVGTVSLIFRPVILMDGGSAKLANANPPVEEEKNRKKKKKEEWTVAVANLVPFSWFVSLPQRSTSPKQGDPFIANAVPLAAIPLSVRLEGPYSTHLHPHPFSFPHLLLIAGGTGITGAVAIARQAKSLLAINVRPQWFRTQCVTLVWTLRECDYISLTEMGCGDVESNFVEVIVHLTGNGRKRLDAAASIERVVQVAEVANRKEGALHSGPFVWIYASGPRGLLDIVDAESREANRQEPKVECYCAHWDQ